MLIDRIYQKVKTFINTEVRGNVSPEEFNLLLHDAIQSRNEEYFFEVNRLQTRSNRGMIGNGLESLPDRFREKILHYLHTTDITLVSDKNNVYNLPTDYRYIDDIIISETSDSLDFCKSNKELNIVKSMATVQYPIYTIQGASLKVFPIEIPSLSVSYLRKAKYPKWTYSVVNNVELFNSDAVGFVDADIHASEEDEIVRRVLERFGVNLKEQDVQSYTIGTKNAEFNQNNAN
jgi:hypothetical protein